MSFQFLSISISVCNVVFSPQVEVIFLGLIAMCPFWVNRTSAPVLFNMESKVFGCF